MWVTMTSLGFSIERSTWVGVHAVLGLDRREAVVHLLPSVEVAHAVADKRNGVRHRSSLPERCPVATNRLQEKRATKATVNSLLPSKRASASGRTVPFHTESVRLRYAPGPKSFAAGSASRTGRSPPGRLTTKRAYARAWCETPLDPVGGRDE